MNNRNMNGEDNTCLSLSLGGRPTGPRRRRDPPVEPSLTLSLSDDINEQISSPVSSFSTIDLEIKKEKDVMNMSEDLEMERVVSSRTSDEDEDGNVRKKLRLTKEQSALLEDKFKGHTTLNPKQKQALARQLNLRPRQVEVWFQNRRARTKLKQTEVEYEFLKRCCETLTNENRKLQREVTELKAVKLGPPVYMQLPAPTLSMCPSCERVVGEHHDDIIDGISKANNTAAGPFVSKPSHFFNPFTTHSATC